jgi:CRISPR-associated endoribonuclease Cas6
MLNFLQDLRLTTYQITLQAQAEGKLPGFLGSTLRGALGHALWRLNCRNIRRNVKPFSCGQDCNCIIGDLWLPKGDFPDGYGGRYQNAPKPFVLEAPYQPEPQFIKRGETIQFSLTFLGAIERAFFRRILPSIEEAAKNLGSQHIPFRVIAIEERLSKDDFHIPDDNTQLIMSIVSPLSIYEKNKVPEALRFGLIVKQLIERLRNLAYLYCGTQWVDDTVLSAYEDRAEYEVKIHQQIVQSVKIYREGDKDPVIGYIGKVSYKGNWQSWYPLLKQAESLNLGKLTDMGYGQVKFSTQ